MNKFLTLALTTTALSAGAVQAADLTKVTFGTNWVAQAEHGGYYQSVVDGTYAECGLDVTILPGGPQVSNDALLVAGRIDFYMGGTLGAFDAVAEGIPMVLVAASFQKDPQVLMTHPGAISSFEELAGLDKLIIGDGGFVTYFKVFEKEVGLEASKRVPYTFNPAPFIADPKSAQQGYITSEPYAIEKEAGWAPDIWLLGDQGYAPYATTIVTMQKTIDDSPDVVKCFVEGSNKGWANFLYGDNAEAVALIQEHNPDMSDDKIAFSIETMKKYGIVDSGDTESLGIGAMTDERMESFFNAMVEVGVVDADVDYKAAYTLEFTNDGLSLPIKEKLMTE